MGERLGRTDESGGLRHVAELSDEDIRFFHELPGGDQILGIAYPRDDEELSQETAVERFRNITKELEAKQQDR